MVCVICGKIIANAKRSTRAYCSAKCRSKAHRSRRRADRQAKSLTPSIWAHRDLKEVEKVSISAHNTIQKMYATRGVETAEMALDAVMAVLYDADLVSKTYWDTQNGG